MKKLIIILAFIPTLTSPMFQVALRHVREERLRKQARQQQTKKNLITEVERALLANENVNENCGNGMTFLHHAAQSGVIEIILPLIHAKADINAKNNDQQTPLHKAAENVQLDVMQLLLYSRANCELTDTNNLTACDTLRIAEQRKCPGYVQRGTCNRYIDGILEKIIKPDFNPEIAIAAMFEKISEQPEPDAQQPEDEEI